MNPNPDKMASVGMKLGNVKGFHHASALWEEIPQGHTCRGASYQRRAFHALIIHLLLKATKAGNAI